MSKGFTSLTAISNYFQEAINNNDIITLNHLKSKSGKDYKTIEKERLETAAIVLHDYIQKYIQEYFEGYSPSGLYKRTGQFIDSVEIDINDNRNTLNAKVYFDDSKSWRDSLWDNQPKGYIPALLNEGWKVKKGRHKNVPHFGYFEGARFVEAAIMEARRDRVFDGIEIVWTNSTSEYGMNY